MEYIAVALLWTSWCFLHSAMISTTVTDYMKNLFGDGFRYYRLVFNIVSVITIAPVLWYSLAIKGQIIFRWQGYLHILQIFMIATGIFLLIAGGRRYDALQFAGIRQIRKGISGGGTLGAGSKIETGGILGKIRHPWYTAGIVIIWAKDMDVTAIIINGILTAYLIIGTILEEKKLVREFGDEYRSYQDHVSMFVPWKWLKSRYRSSGNQRNISNRKR